MIFKKSLVTAPPSTLAESAARAMSTKSKRVVIVDDDAGVREMIRCVADWFYIELVMAASCREARDAMKDGEFDLVMLDVQLTNGTGVELYADIARRRPRWQVVFLTGFASEDVRAKVEAIGPARVYNKTSLIPGFLEQLFLQLGALRK